MEKGQILELKIDDMTREGQGIGKADGFTVFVKDAVAGDMVRAELTKVKKNYGLAKLIELVTPSSGRMEPVCPYMELCGGCAYGRLQYPEQLKLKEKQVKDKLERLGDLKNPLIQPIVPASEIFRYRNKASMAVSTGGLLTKKGGRVEPVHEPRIGFYQAKSHQVIDCEDCLLQSPPAMAAAAALRQFMEEDHITSYDSRWEKGLMRHMAVRTAAGTGEVMVVLVVNGKGIPNGEKLVRMLDEAIYALPIYEDGPYAGIEFSLESVIINVNRKKSQEIFGEECITLAGKPTIMEEVGGLRFEISPLSFYQVNREQMTRLYEKVLSYAALQGGETVLDLYCGVGTIGLFAAAAMAASGKTPGQVIGIESVKQAVLDANRNAVINGIVNARYICGRAEEVLPQLMKEKGSAEETAAETLNDQHNGQPALQIPEQVDVVILDPPRAGCERALLEAVIEAAPERIVYVSCDPATLARDVKILTEGGFRFMEAAPVDMFPWTGHVETVVLMSRAEK